jgi:hypothetical protein
MKLLQAIKSEMGLQEMSADVVITLIDSVERDPLAGLGKYTKKELLADRIAAQWKVCSAQAKGIPQREARPVIADAKVG